MKLRRLALGPIGMAILELSVFATGGSERSPIYPLVYVWLAFVAGTVDPKAAVLTGILAVGAERLLYPDLDSAALVAHGGFMALFASLFAMLLLSETRRARKTAEAQVKDALERVEQDARDFRLIGSSLAPDPSAVEDPGETHKRRTVGSVRAIRESLLDVLEVARLAVKADTAMLFMLSDDGTKLKLKECVATGAERSIIERPIPAHEGALGAVVKTRHPVNLRPKDGGRHLGYRTRSEIGSFLGVPVIADQLLAGVLAVDRADREGFTELDEELLDAVAREAYRAMESERIFVAMDRVKYEQERLYEAFQLLNEALTVDRFAERFLEATRRIKKLDFTAVTLFDEEKQEHTIVGGALKGATFPNKAGGLVAMALKNGHPLPYLALSEQPERQDLLLFGGIETPPLQSVKVFPLLEHGRPLGSLVVGSSVPGNELCREEERMLDVISSHAAITLANARMYKRMEMMATTDGLTGLVNHRRFKELLGEALARASRFGRRVSVLMVDADHFKTINDTHGHPVGDIVLKRIASLLQLEARRTDVVARYGGEEFVVILDETDKPGAEMVAERIRERIEREVIQGDFGRIRVTASLGLATWPEHADSMEDLLERADQALYEAKKKGRNRVVTCRCAPLERPAIGLADRGSDSSPPQVRN